MTRSTRTLVTILCLFAMIILAGILLFQDRLTRFDAALYATMTAIR